MTTTARVTVTESTQPIHNTCHGNQHGTQLHLDSAHACARAHAHTHTQGCLKMYLDAVHQIPLLVVSFKIHPIQIFARGSVFLPLLKLILESCRMVRNCS